MISLNDGKDFRDVPARWHRRMAPVSISATGFRNETCPASVGRDDRIADAGERDAEPFLPFADLLGMLFAQRHLAQDVVRQHHQTDGGQQAGQIDAADGSPDVV